MDITNQEQYNIKFNVYARVLLIFCNLTQIYVQLKDYLDPINGSVQRSVNLIYFANSFVITCLIALSYKFKNSCNLIFIIMILLSYKCNYRCFDFEKTQKLMGD